MIRPAFIVFYMLCLVFCLSSYGDEKNLPPLPASHDELIKDMDRYVKELGSYNALIALDTMEYISSLGKVAVPALLKGLSDPNTNVRGWAAFTLGNIRDISAVEPLITLLEDEGNINLKVLSDDGNKVVSAYGTPLQKLVRQNAEYALRTITGKSFKSVADQKPGVIHEIQRDWKDWWEKSKNTFDPKNVQPIFLDDTPDDAVLYPIPPYAVYLKGLKVCLDPGHGGDTEKIGYKRGATGLREAEINLRVARYLRDFLAKVNAYVLMTRDSDKDIGLGDRAQIANLQNADIFISIHHNWTLRYTSNATTVWYHLNPDHSPASMDIARYLFQGITSSTKLGELDRSGGLKSDQLMYAEGFGVLRGLEYHVPGVLLELSFYSNYANEIKLRSLDFLKKEAYGIFIGLASYAYSGIPWWEVVEPLSKELASPCPAFKIKIQDGLEERKMWGWNKVKIFSRYLSVELDERPVSYSYDPATGILSFTPPSDLAPGSHEIKLWILNIHKNSNLPRVYRFIVTR